MAARRKAEALIVEGRVRVNGRVAELGSRVDPTRDRVELDGKRVQLERKTYLLLNKPRGYVATLSDPEGRPTVMTLLPPGGPRVYPVGRLDFNTEGLLLFTNDGDLANGLMHPRRQVEKTYHVKLRSIFSETDAAALEAGIELDGAPRRARIVGGGVAESGKHSWVELTITEGRNRQVHRMMEAIGHEISRLVRVGYGPLTNASLRLGKWRALEPEELRALAELAGTKPPALAKLAPRAVPDGRRKPTPRPSYHGANRAPKGPKSRSAGPSASFAKQRTSGPAATRGRSGGQRPTSAPRRSPRPGYKRR